MWVEDRQTTAVDLRHVKVDFTVVNDVLYFQSEILNEWLTNQEASSQTCFGLKWDRGVRL